MSVFSLSLNHSAVYLLDDFCILSNVPDACLSGRSKKKKKLNFKTV